MKKIGLIILILALIAILPLGKSYIALEKYDFANMDISKEDKEALLNGTHVLVTEAEEYDLPSSEDYATLEIKNKISLPSYKAIASKKLEKQQAIDLSTEKKNAALTSILDIIKGYDASFDEKDYKIFYSLPNVEENTGTIFLTYYIDNLIGTNKVYLVEIVNGVVDEIKLAGVLKENIESIKTTDNEKLVETAKDFNDKIKKETILAKSTRYFKTNDILNKDNSINKSNLTDEVVESNEKVTYDYNSKKLQYSLDIFYKTPTNTFDGEAIEIELN